MYGCNFTIVSFIMYLVKDDLINKWNQINLTCVAQSQDQQPAQPFELENLTDKINIFAFCIIPRYGYSASYWNSSREDGNA